MKRRVVNRDLWSRAVVLAAAVGLLYYLRTLVHDELQSDNNEDGLNRAYTVYACELLLLIGIGVLWRR
jgi:NADH:ubiquinone oxidoreductase subunit 2 (subunit N)